jgi:hypothetical protein
MKTRFKGESYFPIQVKIVAASLIFIGLVVLLNSPWLGIVIWLVAIIGLTSYYGVEVDTEKKKYREFVFLCGLRIGSEKSYTTIDYIFIKPNRQSQTMHLRAVSSKVTSDVFDSYIKFSDDEKIHLMRMNSKTQLIKKVVVFATMLNVEVVDYSVVNS